MTSGIYSRSSPETRFWSRVEKTDNCWNWKGSKSRGYGQFQINGKKVYTHRFAYELLVGEIPKGLEPDHLCRNHSCVKPDHLDIVTHKENTLRGRNYNREKTHCRYGHEFTEENTLVSDGSRYCRICNREKMRNWRKGQK